MTGSRDRTAILEDRLNTVLALTEANAAEARALAGVGGAEIETMAAGATDAAAADRKRAAHARLTEVRTRIAALETRLAALDRELQAAAG